MVWCLGKARARGPQAASRMANLRRKRGPLAAVHGADNGMHISARGWAESPWPAKREVEAGQVRPKRSRGPQLRLPRSGRRRREYRQRRRPPGLPGSRLRVHRRQHAGHRLCIGRNGRVFRREQAGVYGGVEAGVALLNECSFSRNYGNKGSVLHTTQGACGQSAASAFFTDRLAHTTHHRRITRIPRLCCQSRSATVSRKCCLDQWSSLFGQKHAAFGQGIGAWWAHCYFGRAGSEAGM